MANVTVELTANQVIGAKDHFGTTDNTEALALFQAWVSNHANQWYADYIKKDVDTISAALVADPSQIAAILTLLGL